MGVFLLLAAPLLLAGVAQAEDPFPRKLAAVCDTPQDLGSGCISPYAYEDYLFLDSQAQVPNDYTGGSVWKFTSQQSGFPEVDNDPRELFGVMGMSVDLAWERSTGRPDVVIAVLDSGVRWHNDLILKAYLNRAELPVPQGSTNPLDPWDRNFDGVLNVLDYQGQVADTNGNGRVDPQDLVRRLSDGVDQDANGFVDDISGWNFLDDTNDPFDEVDYGHGTGEARDSVAEANNGGGFPGACPSCRHLQLRVGESFVAHDEDYAMAVLYAVDAGAALVQEALGTIDAVPLAVQAHRYAWDHGVPIVASAADEASFHHNFPAAHPYTIVLNSVNNALEASPFIVAPRSYLYVNGCTNFGGDIWLAVPSEFCSSEATGRGAGMVGLLESHARNLVAKGLLPAHPMGSEFPSGNALSAAEVKQLLRAGADDVDLSTHREVAGAIPTVRYASQPGYDPYTGWGRMNADRTLALLDQGRVPPVPAITSPDYWASFDALQQASFEVAWEVEAWRTPGPYRVQVTFGCGWAPLVWNPVGDALGVAPAPLRGTTPVPTARVAALCGLAPTPPRGPNDFTITVRVQVTDAAGLVGVDQRPLQVGLDPTLMPGWPRLLEGSMEASPSVVDLDADGRDDLVVSTSAGRVHALRADGSELPGFPVATDPMPGLHLGQPAFTSGAISAAGLHDSLSHGGTGVADLDADGDLEIVAPSLNGKVYAWDHQGQRLPGFPVALDPRFSALSMRNDHNTVIHGIVAAPSLADLDGDRDLEVVVAAMDRHVYAWHHDGTPVQGFPVLLADRAMVTVDPGTDRVSPKAGVHAFRGAQILSTTAIGDLDGDGRPEIVVGSNEHYEEPLALSAVEVSTALLDLLGAPTGNGRLYALEADGSYVSGWPVKVPLLAAELLPYVGEGVPGSPALGDLDGDGKDEAAIFATLGPVMVFRGDGTSFYGLGPDGLPLGLSMELVGPASGAVDVPVIPGLGSGSIAALLPGQPSIIVPAAGLGRVLDALLPGEQVVSQDYVQAWDGRTGVPLPAWPRPLEDLQFITNPAVVQVDADPLPEVVEGSGGYLLHAWDATGAESPGFPKATNHWLIATPGVGDLDGDGLREIVAASREGWLWVLRTPAIEALAVDEWASDHHDLANTGRWGPHPALLATPAASDPGTAGASLALLPLLLGVLAVRRHRAP